MTTPSDAEVYAAAAEIVDGLYGWQDGQTHRELTDAFIDTARAALIAAAEVRAPEPGDSETGGSR